MRKLLLLFLLSNALSYGAIIIFSTHVLDQVDFYNPHYVTRDFWAVVMVLMSIFAIISIRFYHHNFRYYALVTLYPIALVYIFYSIVYDLHAEISGGGTWTETDILLRWVLYDEFVISVIVVAWFSQIVLLKLFGGKDAKV